jgi:hypothetical protein
MHGRKTGKKVGEDNLLNVADHRRRRRVPRLRRYGVGAAATVLAVEEASTASCASIHMGGAARVSIAITLCSVAAAAASAAAGIHVDRGRIEWTG